jgi:PAS domain S-box-containing protein
LYLLSEDGLTLDLLGWRNVAPEPAEVPCRLTERNEPSIFAELYAGVPHWAETPSGERRSRDRVREGKRNANAFCRIPLLAEGRPIGLLGMAFHRDRCFGHDERRLVVTMGKQSAQALLRALRLEREWRAQAILTTTMRGFGEAVFATDITGRIRFMNAAAEQLSGWNEGDSRGRASAEVLRIFSEETRCNFENLITKVLQEGEVAGRSDRVVLCSRNGTKIPIEDRAAPIRDDRGILLGVVLVVRDALHEKRP